MFVYIIVLNDVPIKPKLGVSGLKKKNDGAKSSHKTNAVGRNIGNFMK